MTSNVLKQNILSAIRTLGPTSQTFDNMGNGYRAGLCRYTLVPLTKACYGMPIVPEEPKVGSPDKSKKSSRKSSAPVKNAGSSTAKPGSKKEAEKPQTIKYYGAFVNPIVAVAHTLHTCIQAAADNRDDSFDAGIFKVDETNHSDIIKKYLIYNVFGVTEKDKSKESADLAASIGELVLSLPRREDFKNLPFGGAISVNETLKMIQDHKCYTAAMKRCSALELARMGHAARKQFAAGDVSNLGCMWNYQVYSEVFPKPQPKERTKSSVSRVVCSNCAVTMGLTGSSQFLN